jgi:hypothetical protein
MNAVVAQQQTKTHYRKAFNSPYLSSVDIVKPTPLTIAYVTQELDKTKKTKDTFNTAYFKEREIRPGEKLKPMILNATNSKVMKNITGSAFIEDWQDVRVMVYVDDQVKFGRDTVEGLRLTEPPSRKTLTPSQRQQWESAKQAFLRDGSLEKVLARVDISEEHQRLLIEQVTGAAE